MKKLRSSWGSIALSLGLVAVMSGCGDGTTSQNDTGPDPSSLSGQFSDEILQRGLSQGQASVTQQCVAEVSATEVYVVFSTFEKLDTTNDTNLGADIYRRNIKTNETILISADPSGVAGNGQSFEGSISEDGRYVAFTSAANNLLGAGNDTNNSYDIFVRDTASNQTVCVSRKTDGTMGNGHSINGQISLDGNSVVFATRATNLDSTTADTNGQQDVYVRQITDHSANTGTTTRVSIKGTTQANGASQDPVLSGDGQIIAYSTAASNLLSSGSDTNARQDVLLCDLSGPTTTLASVANDGSTQGNGASLSPCLSEDGGRVTFASDSSNLVGSSDTNGRRDVFLRVLGTTPGTYLVSVDITGTVLGNNSVDWWSTLSGDGTKIAYASLANNHLAPDSNSSLDVFFKTLSTTVPEVGELVRCSTSNAGDQGNRNP